MVAVFCASVLTVDMQKQSEIYNQQLAILDAIDNAKTPNVVVKNRIIDFGIVQPHVRAYPVNNV